MRKVVRVVQSSPVISVRVHLVDQSQPILYDSCVLNTYIKEGFYCVYQVGEVVHKYPVSHIWRVIEDYGFHGR